MDIWIATTNLGKIKEMQRILNDFTVYSTKDLPVYCAPKEDGHSFLENAKIKAKSLRGLKKDCWIMADDSGLEIEGLGNLPGVHSARYAGEKASDIENSSKALKMLSLKNPENRKARFVCSLFVLTPDNSELKFEGTCEGNISKTMRGRDGFGYDNIFIPKGEEKTLAELGPAFKNKISHRFKALMKFKDFLQEKK